MKKRQYIARKKLPARYDISEMTLWRWEQDDQLGFPKPLEIHGRKYYDLSEIEAWEEQRALASQKIKVA